MARYARPADITLAVLKRLQSLGTPKLVAQALDQGLDDVIPADLKPSARAYVDPKTGKLFSRTAVQTAKTFHREPDKFRTMKDATPRAAARERLLEDAHLTFPARDWAARQERDERFQKMLQAYAQRLARKGQKLPSERALFAQDSEFRQALDRLSPATPPGLKQWMDYKAARAKARALETLGLRPPGWKAVPGSYTPAMLAKAWADAGVRRAPSLRLKGRSGRRRRS